MKRDMYTFPKSSFLGMVKDTSLIMKKILDCPNVLKLLYYTSKDALDKPNLTADQKQSLFENKQITNIPKIKAPENGEKYSYLVISYDTFLPNATNPHFRDHIVEFRIICNLDNWDLGDFELRPYRIAGELDSIFDEARLTGIGVLQFLSADADVYDDTYAGVTLRYLATRGDEDKKDPLE